MRKLFYILFSVQIIISMVILAPTFYRSTTEFFNYSSLTTKQKQAMIYGYFYRSMMDYIKNIPDNVNAVIIEAPRQQAGYFWILNYFFLPRKIYTCPKHFLFDNNFTKRHNIKYILLTQEQRFYFKKYAPPDSNIIILSPVKYDTLIKPPYFRWLPPVSNAYALTLCNEDAEVLNTFNDLKITLYDQWLMPAELWSKIPHQEKIYWYIQGLDTNVTSRLMVFYKK